jgi:hypothetical protein
VSHEYHYALQRNKEVIPVRFYPVQSWPRALERLQWVDFIVTMNFEDTYRAKLEKLIGSINFHLSTSRSNEAIARARLQQRNKHRRTRFAALAISYSLTLAIIVYIIGRIFFPIKIVQIVPVIHDIPILEVPYTYTALWHAQSVSLLLTPLPSNPILYTGQVVSHFDTSDPNYRCFDNLTLNVFQMENYSKNYSSGKYLVYGRCASGTTGSWTFQT